MFFIRLKIKYLYKGVKIHENNYKNSAYKGNDLSACSANIERNISKEEGIVKASANLAGKINSRV